MRAKIKENIEQLNFLEKFTETSQRLEMKVYIVGGFVRDVLLDRARSEIDFLVVGDGIKFAKNIADLLGADNFSVFKNFGTAHFNYKGIDFEFVGARKESYNHDSRNPIIEKGTFEDDIRRRDFTINTLAISLNQGSYGEIIDSFQGEVDINNKIIRTPLDPEQTFDDDPLRIMRAFRFAAQLNFELDSSLITAAEKFRDRLKIISQERITDEFLKILASDNPSYGLKLMFDTKVLEIVFPEISNLSGVDQRKDYHHKDVFLHTLKVIDNILPNTENVWLRFAALVHDIAKPQTKRFVEGIGWTFHGHEELGARMMKRIFRRMKLPFSKLDYIEKLVRLHLRPIALVNEEVTDSAIRRFIVSAGEDLDDLITLCRADITSKSEVKVQKYLSNYERVMKRVKEVEEKDELRAFQSPVRGEEIMEVCKIPPSKKVGEIKSAIEEAILDGKINNTYEDAYQYLIKIKNEFLDQ
ncbi:MAG: CCA tRNA nucleotidyltransferase [Melioribacteraceae bacterium]|nr:CCA tRNA nucleotidyltransferase [Melioribacteraceae bacterium]MCF8266317.1 CCA tRNA nucleotidyltransferase [Melioribacteraceae bacterium]